MNRRALSLVLLSVAVVESDTCALRLRSSPPAPLTFVVARDSDAWVLAAVRTP